MSNFYHLVDQIKEYVASDYPNESCGLIVNDQVIRCENISTSPENSFAIDKNILAPLIINNSVQCVWHSHITTLATNKSIFDPRWMSKQDMISYNKYKIPWMIFSADDVNVSYPLLYDPLAPTAPYIGRKYIWGLHDCYTLVRDWLRQEQGIELDNPPREFRWWNSGGDMFLDLYKEYRFHDINYSDIQPGDCLLIKGRGLPVSHCAVVVRPETILHHLVGGLSTETHITNYSQMIVKVIRYNGHKTVR